MTLPKSPRPTVSNRFFLELGDGGPTPHVGFLKTIDGGHLKSDTVGEQVGADGLETRYAGRQKFDDITITCGPSMSPMFWKWIKATVDRKYERRNGAVVVVDFDGAERARRTFMSAVIAEIQFPGVDATKKEPVYLSVKFSPEELTFDNQGGSPGSAAARVKDLSKKQVNWVSCNYRFRIDGFGEENCRWVQSVDPMTVKQNVILNPIGKEKYVRKEVGRIDYPTISITVPETQCKPWVDWWKKFVADMDTRQENEKNGSLEYLDNTCKTALTTLHFHNMGILNLTFDKLDASSDELRKVKIDMYCEWIEVQAADADAVEGKVQGS